MNNEPTVQVGIWEASTGTVQTTKNIIGSKTITSINVSLITPNSEGVKMRTARNKLSPQHLKVRISVNMFN